jgi:hypothetical protein
MGMSDESSPAPYPENEAERVDAVRRRALPIAICGLICGVAGVSLLLAKTIDEAHPPAVLAVNLSFCAMMMGVGILFYARGTKGTRLAAVICALAIAVGFVGPLVYAKQTLDYRKRSEDRELGNVAAIANAARKYAVAHDGTYPADMGVLLEENLITPDTLHSPYAGTAFAERTHMGPEDKTRDDFLKYLDAHSDYQYFGGDLKGETILKNRSEWNENLATTSTQEEDAFTKIVVASGKEPIMRIHIAVAFADGRSDFVDLEQAENVVKAANAARQLLGFAAMRPPTSVAKAEKVDGATTEGSANGHQ